MNETELREYTLEPGAHETREAGMCLMELVALLAGEEHSDRPRCASPLLAHYARLANDALDNQRRGVLLPLAPELVDTACDECESRRQDALALMTVREILPPVLRDAGLEAAASSLESAPDEPEEVLRLLREAAAAHPELAEDDPAARDVLEYAWGAALNAWNAAPGTLGPDYAVMTLQTALDRDPETLAGTLRDQLQRLARICPHRPETGG